MVIFWTKALCSHGRFFRKKSDESTVIFQFFPKKDHERWWISTELGVWVEGEWMGVIVTQATLAPAQNMHNFIEIIMSTNYGLFHSFGKSPACPRVNLGLGRFFVDKRFFVDFGHFFQIFHKISALPRASTK